MLYYVPVRLSRNERLSGAEWKTVKKVKNLAWQIKTRWYIISRFAPHRLAVMVEQELIETTIRSIKEIWKKFQNRLAKIKNRFYIMKRAKNERASASSRVLNPDGAKLIKNLINLQKTVWQNRNWWYIKRYAPQTWGKLIENWIVRCKPWKFIMRRKSNK